MATEIDRLRQSHDSVGLRQVGTVLARAVQPPAKNADGKEGGTLYSYFVGITDMQFVLVFKLNNAKKVTLDLKKEFAGAKAHTIEME